jgi:hypothetical protein
VIVIAVAAGAVGVNQWVAAGNAADTTAAAPETTASPAPPAAAAASTRADLGESVRPATSRETTWPGLGPDWAQPNPRREMLNAILNGIWSGILQAFLPDPYRSARHPASRDRAP